MASVAGYEAVLVFVSRPANPVRGLGASGAVDHVIYFALVLTRWAEEPRLRIDRFHHFRTVAAVTQDVALDFTSGGAETLLPRRNEARITGQVILLKRRDGRVHLCHFI